MFEFAEKEPVSSKCYVTHGVMGHLDPKQPPTKRKPFSAILGLPFVHRIDLLLPAELYDIVHESLAAKFSNISYSRVILPLSALLTGDFFTEYIKKGNVLMLSEGVHGIDNVYSLREGILTLSLDKESYERAGLVGKPEGVKGSRGARARWVVEINLRLPSMLHGKKGFDRIVYAFKNALQQPVTWLFADLDASAISPSPLAKHFPVLAACTRTVHTGISLSVPHLQPPRDMSASSDDFRDMASDLYEWLSLVSLQNPRLEASDDIDPYLSRYTPPSPQGGHQEPQALAQMTWQGFMSGAVAYDTLITVLQKATPQMWFSISANSFAGNLAVSCKDCTILKLPGPSNEFMLWEIDQE